MSEQEPPEWAIKLACERAGYGHTNLGSNTSLMLRAFAYELARTIAEHEEEPVDPVFEALVEGAREVYRLHATAWPGAIPIAQRQMAKLKELGIEIAKAGDA